MYKRPKASILSAADLKMWHTAVDQALTDQQAALAAALAKVGKYKQTIDYRLLDYSFVPAHGALGVDQREHARIQRECSLSRCSLSMTLYAIQTHSVRRTWERERVAQR